MLWIVKELIENSSLFQLVVTDGAKVLEKAEAGEKVLWGQ